MTQKSIINLPDEQSKIKKTSNLLTLPTTSDLPLTTFIVNGKRKTNLLEKNFKNNVRTTQKKEKI